MVTVLTETARHDSSGGDVSGDGGDALWLAPDDMLAATGWQLKPEGFCQGDMCVPVPDGREHEFVRDDAVNVSAFWRHMGHPAVNTASGDTWFLGAGAAARNEAMLSLEAPDFTLPDLDGNLHSLTDFRRQKVLLITWASW